MHALIWLVGLVAAVARPSSPTPELRVGLCVDLAHLEAAQAAGFAYVELPVRDVAALSDADFVALQDRLKRLGLAVQAGNLFLPGELKITGAGVDTVAVTAYVDRAFGRMAALGAEIVVLGSGGARRIPDGFPTDEAWQQLVTFARRTAESAQVRGLTMVIEPLQKKETNLVNTAAEGLKLVNAVNHPHFQLMIDMYHLAAEREDLVIVARAGTHLRHVHIANPAGRAYPMADGEYDYHGFFRALRRAGYQGRVSVEGNSQQIVVDGTRALAFLHATWKAP